MLVYFNRFISHNFQMCPNPPIKGITQTFYRVSTITQPQDKCQEICFVYSCCCHAYIMGDPEICRCYYWMYLSSSWLGATEDCTAAVRHETKLSSCQLSEIKKSYLGILQNVKIVTRLTQELLTLGFLVVELKDILSNVASAICGCVEISSVLFLGKI